MYRRALISTLLALTISVSGQYNFDRSFDISVYKSGDKFERAWEGGLNYPIFSNADVNGDGKEDLIGYDKSGKRLVVFDHDGLEFSAFPFEQALDRWVLFRDFNCDGEMDLFTGTSGGIKVYKNTGNFQFVEEVSILQSQYPTFKSNLYVSNSDIPGIVDVDGDGDLDILTFEINGVYIEWHRNTSIENFGHCNSLQFQQETPCWGLFEENGSTNTIELNKPCANPSPPLKKPLHAGSTITTLDQNYDGDIDVILGDISFNTSVFVENGGSSNSANGTAKDENFPHYNTPINLHIFPYSSYVDADFDGKNDLLTVSNDDNVGANKTVIFHKNIGINNDTFELSTSQFLVDEMLDFGSGAYPTMIDINQDGLLDLLVGSSGINTNGAIVAQLAFLKNTGTTGNPQFELENEDYIKLSSINEGYLHPTTGDIDGDGDDDLLIGLLNGKIAYYNNQAGANNPANFVLADGNYQSIDVGAYAAPQLFDINDDGLLDLIIGEQQGTLTYYENKGTSSIADFSVAVEDYGNITTQDFSVGLFFGYSTPHYFQDGDSLRLLVGGESGRIEYYARPDLMNAGTIELTDDNFGKAKDGGRSSVWVHNLNNDNYLDMFIGNLSGGLAYHEGIEPVSINEPITYDPTLSYFVNNGVLFIQNQYVERTDILGLSGKLIKRFSQNKNQFNLQDIPSGIYIGLIKTKEGLKSFKFKL